MFSLVIPVYKNELNIPDLLSEINQMPAKLKAPLEVLFVVDGSPDQSYELLRLALPNCKFSSQLINLSRNFGSFAAIRTGLEKGRGKYFAVMAADLQEPPSLITEFFEELSTEKFDVVVATRESRADPFLDRMLSNIFWTLYRRIVNNSIPPGGVDIFGCNHLFRDALLKMDESNSSLIGLLFWLGFRRKFISYRRLERTKGKSAWSFAKKLKYFNDSIFAFSDVPIKLLMSVGILGMFVSSLISVVVLILKARNEIVVPGYAATALMISFFGALNMFGIGMLGNYIWRIYENTKARPLAVIMDNEKFDGKTT